MSTNINGKMTPQTLDAIAPLPNEGETAKQITKLVNAAGAKVEQTIKDIKDDAAPMQARAKTRKGATIAADVATGLVGAAFLVAGGPFGIAAGVALVGGALLHAVSVTGPAVK